jgi:hypothetical protein
VTVFVNLRAGSYGAVCSPYVLQGNALVEPPALTSVFWNALPILVRDRDVLLATHGFNVSYDSGLRSLARLEQTLGMRSNEIFLGVLWPGDWAIPAINYPFEDRIASQAGKLLGGFCNSWLGSARSVSMLSHSLGARVVLDAIQASRRRIKRACITAGAVNAACLAEEYAKASANCDEIRTLSSRGDLVLQFAFPPGDMLADLLDPDHPPFEAALGRGGPASPQGANVRAYEIPDTPRYDHSDYMPPSDITKPLDPNGKWAKSAAFMAAAFRGVAPPWP